MFRPNHTTTQLTGDIFDILHQFHWATAEDVARSLGIRRETAWRHLGILVRADLVVKDDKTRPHRYRVAQPRPGLDYL